MKTRRTSKPYFSPTFADQVDVRLLACTLEVIVASIDYPTRAFASHMALQLVSAYCLGRGLKCTAASLNRHRGLLIRWLLEIIAEIVSHPARDECYPTLAGLGFTSFEEVVAHMQSSDREGP